MIFIDSETPSRRSLNKLILIVFLLVLIIIAGGFYFVFLLKKIKKPSISTGNPQITQITFESLKFAVDLTLENPNKLSITLQGFEYEIWIDGKSVLTGTHEKSIVIAEKAKTVVELPAELHFQKIQHLFQSGDGKKEVPLQIKIITGVELPVLGKIKISIEPPSLSIPVLRPPIVKNVEFKKKKMDPFSGAELECTLQLENNNELTLELTQFTYAFAVNQQTWAQGQDFKGVLFKKGDQNFLTIPVKLSFASMGASAKDLILGGKPLNYTLDGDVEFKTDLPTIPVLRWKLNKSGESPLR